MRHAPGLAEDRQPQGVPVGVQGRLAEREIDIRRRPEGDQLRAQQMKTFIPGEGQRLGIPHQTGADKGHGGAKQEIGAAAPGGRGSGFRSHGLCIYVPLVKNSGLNWRKWSRDCRTP